MDYEVDVFLEGLFDVAVAERASSDDRRSCLGDCEAIRKKARQPQPQRLVDYYPEW
jgi:hypothetical protein